MSVTKLVNKIIQQELGPDEKILWTGQPPQGVRFFWHDIIGIPFSIFMFLVSLALFPFGYEKDAPVAYVFGGVLGLIMIYSFINRFFIDKKRRRKTLYCLTNERILMMQKNDILSLNLNSELQVDIKQHSRGRGSIGIGRKLIQTNDDDHIGPTMFLDRIENARQVYTQINELIIQNKGLSRKRHEEREKK